MIKWKISKIRNTISIYFNQRMLNAEFNSLCEVDDKSLEVYTEHLLNEEDLEVNIVNDGIRDGSGIHLQYHR